MAFKCKDCGKNNPYIENNNLQPNNFSLIIEKRAMFLLGSTRKAVSLHKNWDFVQHCKIKKSPKKFVSLKIDNYFLNKVSNPSQNDYSKIA